MNGDQRQGEKLPPAVQRGDPEPEIEEKVRQRPDDLDAKADLGSDESMDASDPPSSAQPGTSDEPAPSSGYPE